MESRTKPAFAVWVTGLPASGKSTLVASLKAQLSEKHINVAVLESDVLRHVFTPEPRYDERERELFYRQMAFVGMLLNQHGVPVLFDATGNRRTYRAAARARIPNFLEVYVDSPLEVCVARDPKGIYREGREGGALAVPGMQAIYEPPENPELVVHGDRETPDSAAQRVVGKLVEKGYLIE